MKILNRTEFLALPAGVLYRIQRMPNHSFGEIHIKGDNCEPNDFVCIQFGYSSIDDETDMWLDQNISRPIRTDYYRDGDYNDPLFLVYETWDLEQMRGLIDHAITIAPKQKFHHPWEI